MWNITSMKTRSLLVGLIVGLVLVLTLILDFKRKDNPLVFNLPELSPDWIASGEDVANHFGYSVNTAGDVNGDGYDDIVVGADRYKQFTGRVYVYLGSADGLSNTAIFTATGEGVNNHFGYTVDTAGDVNGDGYDDVIVGAYHYQEFTGRVYVYAGNPDGLNPMPIFTVTGEEPYSYFGRSVGWAGDVNGDGYDDVLVGAQAFENWSGRVYLYAGNPDGLEATPIFTATGEGPSNSFGRSVGTAGDVNGDGYADVLVGAPGYGDFTGRIYVYAGGPDGLRPVPIFTATGEGVKDRFGFSAGMAGDVNHDGYDDLIAGSGCYGNNTGRAYVFAGGIAGPNANPIFIVTGEANDNYFGYAVGTAGDWNGDGYTDVIVGAYHYNDSTGRVYIYPGISSGLSITPILTATGEDLASSFGRAVGLARDVNGDGNADIIIGASGYNNWMGRVYVYYGKNITP
jgi:hypothetical protein